MKIFHLIKKRPGVGVILLLVVFIFLLVGCIITLTPEGAGHPDGTYAKPGKIYANISYSSKFTEEGEYYFKFSRDEFGEKKYYRCRIQNKEFYDDAHGLLYLDQSACREITQQ